MTIPYDIARCPGVSFEEEDGIDWREGCEHCLRRTSPNDHPQQSYIEPPPIIVF